MARQEFTLPKIEYMQPLPDKDERERMADDLCKIFALKRTIVKEADDKIIESAV